MQPVAVAAFAAVIKERVRSVRRIAFTVALVLSTGLLLLVMLMPLEILGIYMSLDAGVHAVGATAVRLYCLGIPFAAVNVVSTYCFQATLKRRSSFAVSILRGLIFPSVLCIVLPLVMEARLLFPAVALAETLTLAVAVVLLIRSAEKGCDKQ